MKYIYVNMEWNGMEWNARTEVSRNGMKWNEME